MVIRMQWEYLLKFLNHRLGVLDKKVISQSLLLVTLMYLLIVNLNVRKVDVTVSFSKLGFVRHFVK